MRIRDFALIAALVIAAPRAPLASDGTTDILVDPAAGFTISERGSYRLVADAVINPGITAIRVLPAVSGAVIDLNGHTLTGTGAVAGAFGIDASGGANNLEIRNGTIQGFTASGVVVGSNCILRGLRVRANGVHGISAETEAVVEDCVALGNGASGAAAGIKVGDGSAVRRCTSSFNAATGVNGAIDGILGGADCAVTDCVANSNSSTGTGDANGIRLTGNGGGVSGSVCAGNTSPAGEASGIAVGNGATVTGNTCRANSGGSSNGSVGITTGSGCSIVRNTCSENSGGGANSTGKGISASGSALIEGNTCRNNDGSGTSFGVGIGVFGAFNRIANNLCEGNSSPGGSGIGISASRDTIIGNTCDNNDGGGSGGGTGISAFGDCIVRDNTCIRNSGLNPGTGPGTGIRATDGCRIEGNSCLESTSAGSAVGTGILVTGEGNYVADNMTRLNESASINFSFGAASKNRSERNSMHDFAVTNPPASSGVGNDLDFFYGP